MLWLLSEKKKLRNGDRKCRMEFGTEKNPGKLIRNEPAIVQDTHKNLRLELERDHPNLVQHSKIHCQAWRANGDISILLSNSNPKTPSSDDIFSVEQYVSGYICKDNTPNGAIHDFYEDLTNSDPDTSTSFLCNRLLMKTTKRDVSAVEASYEISKLPLYRCSHKFQSISLSGYRRLERNGAIATKKTPLDRYLTRPEHDDDCSLYKFISTSNRIPVVNGGHTRATWPLTENYCRTMLMLHFPGWRNIEILKPQGQSWIDAFQLFTLSDSCPTFVTADIQRARKSINLNIPTCSDDDSDSDTEQGRPEWMELIHPNSDLNDILTTDFDYDDGGPEYDWSHTSKNYASNYGKGFIDNLPKTRQYTHTVIPDIDLETMNNDQKFAFNIVCEILLKYVSDPNSFQSHLRMVVMGSGGSGKSYLIKAIVKAVRLVLNNNSAVQVICPTSSAANLIDGCTLHSFLKIPTRKKTYTKNYMLQMVLEECSCNKIVRIYLY